MSSLKNLLPKKHKSDKRTLTKETAREKKLFDGLKIIHPNAKKILKFAGRKSQSNSFNILLGIIYMQYLILRQQDILIQKENFFSQRKNQPSEEKLCIR